MRRVILILAAAVLGVGGCRERHHDGCFDPITIYWHFDDVRGTAELPCNQAGVSIVRIRADQGLVGDFACSALSANGVDYVQGITLEDYAEVPHDFELIGLDASGNALFRDTFSFEPSGCIENQIDRTLPPIVGDLDIDFHFTDIGFTCTFADSYIWYELLDRNGQQVDIVGPNDPKALPCANGPIALSSVPFGLYTVSRIQEVVIANDNSYTTYHATCDAQSFQHLAAGETTIVQVPPSSGTCF